MNMYTWLHAGDWCHQRSVVLAVLVSDSLLLLSIPDPGLKTYKELKP